MPESQSSTPISPPAFRELQQLIDALEEISAPQERQRSSSHATSTTASRTLWIGNLPKLDGVVDADYIKQAMERLSIEFRDQVTKVEFVRNRDNELQGHGFITFGCETAAQGCLALLNGEPMPGVVPIRYFKLEQCTDPSLTSSGESGRQLDEAGTSQPTVATTAIMPAPSFRASSNLATCCVCADRAVDCVLYRCGHENLCFLCAKQVQRNGNKCPVCRRSIDDVIKTFR